MGAWEGGYVGCYACTRTRTFVLMYVCNRHKCMPMYVLYLCISADFVTGR